MSRGAETRRVVLAGHGVSDARRRAWGHVALPMRRQGLDVRYLDLDDLDDARPWPHFLAWLLRNPGADAVVTLGLDGGERDLVRVAHEHATPVVAVDDGGALDPDRPRPSGRFDGLVVLAGITSAATAPATVRIARLGGPLERPGSVPAVCRTMVHGAALPSLGRALASLASSGTTRFLGARWARHPESAPWAHGDPHVVRLPARLAAGEAVVVPESGCTAHDELRLREARCSGRPVTLLTDGGDLRALPAAADDPFDALAGPVWPEVLDRLLPARPATHVTARPAWVPRVSVALPVFDAERYLRTAVTSVLDQTCGDLELLVLDDGSTDSTVPIVEGFGDPRVRVVRQENVGGTGAFQFIWQAWEPEARGDVIAFIGRDDVFHPRRLERVLAVFDTEPCVDVVHTGVQAIDSQGAPTRSLLPDVPDYDRWTLARELYAVNFICHPALALRRRALERVGPFRQGYVTDYDFWLRSATTLQYRYLPEPLVAFRFHEGSASSSSSGSRVAIDEAAAARRSMRRCHTIVDLYPELDVIGSGVRMAQIAHVDLAGLVMARNPVFGLPHALEELDEALALGPDPVALFNRAVARGLLRATSAATEDVAALRSLHGELAALAERTVPLAAQGRWGGDVGFLPSRLMGFDLRSVQPPAPGIWRWDGGRRVEHQVVFDPAGHPDTDLAAVLAAYGELFRANDPVRLVVRAPAAEAEAVRDRVLAVLASLGTDPATLAALDVDDVTAGTPGDVALTRHELDQAYRDLLFAGRLAPTGP